MATAQELASLANAGDKEWSVIAATGTPAAAIGNVVTQTIQTINGVASVVWFNNTTNTIFTVAPVIANLRENFAGPRYNAILPTTVSGQATDMQTDARGRLITSTGASNYVNLFTTSANLAAAATYNSGIQDVLSAPALVVSITATQNISIVVTQYSDAAGLLGVEATTFTRLANVPFNMAVKMSGSYVRVQITNNGGAATTTFLAEGWGGVLETLPTALTNSGNLKVAVMENSSSLDEYALGFSWGPTATAATDIMTIRGSASKLVKVRSISISAQATAAANIVIIVDKRSAANTGGTVAGSLAPTPLDSTSATSGSLITLFSTNPTGLGAGVGLVAAARLQISSAAAGAPATVFTFDPPITLRGVTQHLAVNWGSASIPGVTAQTTVSLAEE